MTHVQQTSLLAYREVQKSLGKRQREVLYVLEAATASHFDLTNCELAFLMKLPINCVVPRVYELREKGIVVQSCKRRCGRTGRLACAWKVRK
jgi:hypothetical protein